MNILPVGQNQNKRKTPNFKAAVVATIPKNKFNKFDLVRGFLDGALTKNGTNIVGCKLSASSGRRHYIWLENETFESLSVKAKGLVEQMPVAGVTLRVLKGIPKAIRKRAAEIASKK